jgi:hypothetical protein
LTAHRPVSLLGLAGVAQLKPSRRDWQITVGTEQLDISLPPRRSAQNREPTQAGPHSDRATAAAHSKERLGAAGDRCHEGKEIGECRPRPDRVPPDRVSAGSQRQSNCATWCGPRSCAGARRRVCGSMILVWAFRPRAYWQANPNQLSLGMMRTYWTPERDEELQRHAAAGLSAAKIAVLLYTTRGAVLGRSNRLRGKASRMRSAY